MSTGVMFWYADHYLILLGCMGLAFTFGFFLWRSSFCAYGAAGLWILTGMLSLQTSAAPNPGAIIDVYMGLFWMCVGFTIACALLPSLMRPKPEPDDFPIDSLGEDMSAFTAPRKRR